jgi:hypothetical protein
MMEINDGNKGRQAIGYLDSRLRGNPIEINSSCLQPLKYIIETASGVFTWERLSSREKLLVVTQLIAAGKPLPPSSIFLSQQSG